jgi:hypothetical protein
MQHPLTPAEVRRIAIEIAREEVMHHEIRFTVLGGAVVALVGLLWLMVTGRF